jgi:competence protein ComEC
MVLRVNINSVNPLFFCIYGFIIGVFVSSFVFIPPLISLLVLGIGVSILIAEKIQNRKVSREVLAIGLLIISVSLGSLRYEIKNFHEVQMPTEEGVVVSDPEDRENTKRFVFLSNNGEKVLVSAPLYSEIQYGDVVKVAGEFERPGIIESEEGGRIFDYGKYLSKDDIYHILLAKEVEKLGEGGGNPVKAFPFKIKRGFVNKMREVWPEPHAGLLAGLLIAGRDALPKDILEEFRRAGVIHIVVLSGFNITLIAEFLRRSFQTFFLWVKWVTYPKAPAVASVLGVILFVVMTGGEATVVRAALMALTVILASFWGRNYSASRALLAAGFLMVLHNPKILVFDPSFQLSFLATLGLMHLMIPISERITFVSERFGLREIISQTLSTQIAVLPLLIYSVGDISLVSLPANILTLLVVPWTMLIGFIATLLAFISSLLSWPIAFITHLLLSWILFVSQLFASLPFATIKLPPLSFWVVVLAVAILGGFIWWRSRNSPQSFAN